MTTTSPNFLENMNTITNNCKKMIDSCTNYKSIYPVVIEMIAKYGAENIYLVSNNYHGRYEDDYADFTYYNNITGEFFTDSWTTAFSCPRYELYEHIYIDQAFNEGVVNKELLYSVLKKKLLKILENFTYIDPWNDFDELARIGLRVNVSNGRKWKGTGFLVDTYCKSYQWDTPRWKSDNGYGLSTTRYAKVLDPVSGEINAVTAKNIKFMDLQKFVEEYRTKMIAQLEATTVENLKIGDKSFYYSLYSGDHNSVGMTIDYGHIEFIKWITENHANRFDISTYHDIEKEKADKKAADFKASKMPKIIEWVKNNTDKITEEDIIALAEHIFNKKY